MKGLSHMRLHARAGRKKRKKARTGKLEQRLKHHLGAIDHGAELDAKIYGAKLGVRIYGAELPAKSPPRLRRAQDLGASNDCAEQCKLGASNYGAELRVQILKSYLQGHICKKKFKKKAKNKKKIGPCVRFIASTNTAWFVLHWLI